MIGKNIKKIDSDALLSAKPSFTEDFANMPNTLTVKILRSPHAFAKIVSIRTDIAKKVPGIVDIYTYHDVPQTRYTDAGESLPEASPYDRLLLEPLLRYVGDEVAIIAAETEESAEKAMRLIQVEYEVYKPILDVNKAMDNPIIIHPEEDILSPFDFGHDHKRNIVSQFTYGKGDVEKEFQNCEVVIEHTYNTQAQAHCMLEMHKSYAYLDVYNRVVVISANQSAYHMRRQIARANNLSLNKVRVIKPRIGGGFGGKNIAVLDPYTAFVTLKTGRPCKLFFTRKETFTASCTRHAMQFTVKLGADKDGTIKAIHTKSLNNTGAYGGNGPAVTMEAAQNVYPLYNRVNAILFEGTTVYTNLTPAGPLRGYGATQGAYAIEAAMNELAVKLNIDPIELRLKNTIRKGDQGGVLRVPIQSLNIEACINKGKELIGWDKKYPYKQIDEHTIRAVGMAIATHSTGVSCIDLAAVTIRLNEDGTYMLFTASSDLGTGSDTVLSQIAATALHTDMDYITLVSGDSDSGPYDKGAYASCSTYLTGNAIVRAAKTLTDKMLKIAEKKLNVPSMHLCLKKDRIELEGKPDIFITLKDMGCSSASGYGSEVISVTDSYGMDATPRPFSAGFAEVEVDLRTGELKLLHYVNSIDCGTIINENLARIQAEGGSVQGIGLAMFEEPVFDDKGKMLTDSFMQYKIPARTDLGKISIDFQPDYEPSGPYGAKSLAELVVHAASPSIVSAVYHATGVQIRDLPVTSEKIYMGLKNKK